MPQINMPREKRDPLQTILAGVQIAGGILGIKENLEKSDLTKLQIKKAEEEQKRQQEGRLLPSEYATALQKFQEVPEGTAGSVKFISPTTNAPVFLQPKPEGDKDLLGWAKLGLEKEKLRAEKVANAAKLDLDERIRADDIKEKFTKDTKTQLFQSGFEVSQELQNLLLKDDPIIDAISLRKVFKMAGDVGTIKAEDLQQLGSSPALIDQAVSAINMALKGDRIQPEQRKSLMTFAKDMEANNRIKLLKHAESFADRLANVTKFKKNQAVEYLNPSGLLFDIPLNGKSNQQQIGSGQAGAAPKKSTIQVLDEFNSMP